MFEEISSIVGLSDVNSGKQSYSFSNYTLVLCANAIKLEVPLEALIECIDAYDISDQIVLEDFLLRVLHRQQVPEGISIHKPGQFILQRSCLRISRKSKIVDIYLQWCHSSLFPPPPPSFYERLLSGDLIDFIDRWAQTSRKQEGEVLTMVRDARAIRRFVAEQNGIAFIGNGSTLARSGNTDGPLEASNSIPFSAPTTLERELSLPSGKTMRGLLIPRGVTLITGGGFHGKSTLLRALSMGSYDKVSQDGREYCVTAGRSMNIRSEDGRSVSTVDISPFISNLPPSAGIDVCSFSTNSASGSTSQAAAVMEGIELNCNLFLLDEDTSAGNFMIRDSRMRSLIANEPITPYIYRVNSLWKQLGISTIVVIGGSGDWFDVQDCTLQLDDYVCRDVTRRVLQISKTFCTGRVEYNGRGLVHQLPWTHGHVKDRLIDLGAIVLPAGSTISASIDGSVLYYGTALTLDLSKVEQKIPSIEAQAGAIGIGVALHWISTTMCGKVSLKQVLAEYGSSREQAEQFHDCAIGICKPSCCYILPLPEVLGASINRIRLQVLSYPCE